MYNEYLSVGECKCQERQWGTIPPPGGNCKDESDGVCGAWCYVDYYSSCTDKKWRLGWQFDRNTRQFEKIRMIQSCQACKDKEVTKPPGPGKLGDRGNFIFTNNLFIQDSCNCGKAKKSARSVRDSDVEHHISHGGFADPDQYPWIVRLQTRKPGGGYGICTGAVIDNMHVLTAAHCVRDNLRDLDLSPESIKIYLGNDWRKPMDVAKIYIHESWKSAYKKYSQFAVFLSHDIAVMRLKHSRSDLTPICLPSNPRDKYVGQTAVAAGFGRNEHGQLPHRLMKTSVKIVSIKQCNYKKRTFGDGSEVKR